MKLDLTNYDKKELFLHIDNTYKYYVLQNDLNKLIKKINDDFIYTYHQIKYLVNNI